MHFRWYTIRVRISRMFMFGVLDLWTFELENLLWGTTLANHLVRVGTLTLKKPEKVHCWDRIYLFFDHVGSRKAIISYPIWIKNKTGRTSNGIRNSIHTKIEFITDLEKSGKVIIKENGVYSFHLYWRVFVCKVSILSRAQFGRLGWLEFWSTSTIHREWKWTFGKSCGSFIKY